MALEMRAFTDEPWKLLSRSWLPSTTEVTRIRCEYTSAFKRYLQLPSQMRKGELRAIRGLI
jgi:hypothetical protein